VTTISLPARFYLTLMLINFIPYTYEVKIAYDSESCQSTTWIKE
jgi:hypothetical protein